MKLQKSKINRVTRPTIVANACSADPAGASFAGRGPVEAGVAGGSEGVVLEGSSVVCNGVEVMGRCVMFPGQLYRGAFSLLFVLLLAS